MFPTLIKIVGRTGYNNELMVCENYKVSHYECIPKSKGNLYEYKKQDIGETTTYDIHVLDDPNVVQLNSFNFDKALLLYYNTTGKPKYEYAYRKTLLE